MFLDFFNNINLYKIYTFLSMNPKNPIIILLLILLLITTIHFSKNIIHIIILLLLIYILTGFLFLLLGFDFLGFMFLIIYAGAIIILFIFVLMLIELKNLKNKKEFYTRFYYFIFLIILFILFNFLIFNISYITYLIDYSNNIMHLNNLKLMLILKFYNNTSNLIEFSYLVKIAYILFYLSWFETLFLGFVLLLALIFIIFFFKK